MADAGACAGAACLLPSRGGRDQPPSTEPHHPLMAPAGFAKVTNRCRPDQRSCRGRSPQGCLPPTTAHPGAQAWACHLSPPSRLGQCHSIPLHQRDGQPLSWPGVCGAAGEMRCDPAPAPCRRCQQALLPPRAAWEHLPCTPSCRQPPGKHCQRFVTELSAPSCDTRAGAGAQCGDGEVWMQPCSGPCP